MKALQRSYSAFLTLGFLTGGLFLFNFLIKSPTWDGFLSPIITIILPCCAVTFFTAAIVLRTVRKALGEK